MEPICDDERRATFYYYLRRAIFFGERHEVSCIGLTGPTWNAIGVVAQEFPNVTFESVMLARNEFERQLDGRQADEALARYRRTKRYRPEYSPDALNTRQRPQAVGHQLEPPVVP